ncbi:MAG TPA: IscS subfamily cysteine desulfurase [Flavisolibacter sp.]|jgi:cysteine desulfurase|nr:IscS subfamily cysteine desulfurase [Flavisolibacter sp.]
MLHLPIYLDYNSTTPCDEKVVEAMLPYFTQNFGNAASKTHSFGWYAEEAVEFAREQVADLIAAEKNEIVFTSGATEAINLALKGIVETYSSKGNHIITSNIEHKAVLDTCKHLERQGVEITYLPVNTEGLISAQQIEEAIRPNTILIAIMYANNEIGTRNPVREIGAVARKHSVLFFTDATQAISKIAVNVNDDNIDIMAFSSHKIYGPKGVGALYVRRKNPRVKLIAQIDGGGHERGMRSGTLNVPGIVGFGKAAELCKNEIKSDLHAAIKLRDKLENALLNLNEVYVNGSKEFRLPNVTNLSFKNVEGQALMMNINKEIAVSSGSACTSASLEPSYVLKALGLDDELAHSSIRFSLGRFTTEAEIDFTIQQVSKAVTQLRAMNPVETYNNN